MKSWVPLILVLASCSSESGGGAASPGPSDAAGTGDAGAPDAPTGSDASAPPPVEWAACDTTDWPTAYPKPSKETECASIEVPLDRGDLSGATLALRVARQRASANPTGRVVFVLEGGPGGSAVFTSGMIPQALPGVLGSFDLVYVDSRGTGGSGYLGCPKQPTAQADWLACAKANAGVPLGHYLSSDNARDLEAVRVRLGYDRIHIFATSYGTRVAFEYLRLFEDKVVAGVLDGVAPPPTDLFTNSVTSGDRGVALLVSDCEADPACTAVAPNLAANLLERRAVLEQTPRPITVDGKQAYEALEDYVALLHALMRDAGWRYRVPKAIHSALAGDHTLWNLLMTEALGAKIADAVSPAAPPSPPLFAPGLAGRLEPAGFGAEFSSRAVNAAVLCAEALPNSPGVAALNALFAQQLWGTKSIVDKANTCAAWAVAPLPETERQLVSSSRPLLLLSGVVDINLDPKWAKIALSKLEQAHLIEVPYAAHLPSYVPCVGKIDVQFLEADGDHSKVDDSCLNTLPAPGWN
jgi:pimeloyl-ACP methyl ester carboxylesterase